MDCIIYQGDLNTIVYYCWIHVYSQTTHPISPFCRIQGFYINRTTKTSKNNRNGTNSQFTLSSNFSNTLNSALKMSFQASNFVVLFRCNKCCNLASFNCCRHRGPSMNLAHKHITISISVNVLHLTDSNKFNRTLETTSCHLCCTFSEIIHLILNSAILCTSLCCFVKKKAYVCKQQKTTSSPRLKWLHMENMVWTVSLHNAILSECMHVICLVWDNEMFQWHYGWNRSTLWQWPLSILIKNCIVYYRHLSFRQFPVSYLDRSDGWLTTFLKRV